MTARRKPNILILHGDEHRADCVDLAGADVRTPNLSALAAEGVNFTRSFCPYPVCTPSRYSLLCGRYVHEHGGWSNHSTLAPDIPTFPRALRDAGWRTTAVGKMHFTPTYLDVGFETMRLAEQAGDGRWDDDYHRELMEAGLVDRLDLTDQRAEYRKRAPEEYWRMCGAMPSDLPEAWHSTTWIGDRAVEELQRWPESGAMLMVGFVKPHHPFDPPAPWDRMYDPDTVTPPPGWTESPMERDISYHPGFFPHADLTEATLRRITAMYYATISHMDCQIGRMMDTLRRRGLDDNTLVVYTSDHGDYLGFHHLLLKGGYMYDPLVRVPLIVRWPDRARRGETRETLVTNVDLAPTLLRFAGLTPPETMNGLDLADPGADREVVFAESDIGRQAMARTHSLKLIVDDRLHRRMLFDIENDPMELRDVSDARPDDVRRLAAGIAAWRGQGTLRGTFVDERAPIVEGPNVPPKDLSHRGKIQCYFDARMNEELGA